MKTIKLGPSKSLVNRLLILQSFSHQKEFGSIDVESEDIFHLKQALRDLKLGKRSFHLGEGGTSFRFFLLRLSRETGTWDIRVARRLLERPQEGLYELLKDLGAIVEVLEDEGRIKMVSQGWKKRKPLLTVEVDKSSQFLSSLLLSCVSLESSLKFNFETESMVSESYFHLTEELCGRCGLEFHIDWEKGFGEVMPLKDCCEIDDEWLEPDMSSAFTAACWGALHQGVFLSEVFPGSGQPDCVFLNIFKQVGISFEVTQKGTRIFPYQDSTEQTKSDIHRTHIFDLNSAPDLFPCLCVLLSFLPGTYFFKGLSHLKYKESNRLEKTRELLSLFSIELKERDNLLYLEKDNFRHQYLEGQISTFQRFFSVDQDHRMAFAAGLLMSQGLPLEVDFPEVVNKSYSSFWKDIEVTPGYRSGLL